MPDLGEVFISYSQESKEHIDSVLALSNRFWSDGSTSCSIGIEVDPPEGWFDECTEGAGMSDLVQGCS